MATNRILLATETLAIGRFRCPPEDVRWRRENWIGPRHHVVFPARSVLIEQVGREPILADAASDSKKAPSPQLGSRTRSAGDLSAHLARKSAIGFGV